MSSTEKKKGVIRFLRLLGDLASAHFDGYFAYIKKFPVSGMAVSHIFNLI
jgi:hypothetical protein